MWQARCLRFIDVRLVCIIFLLMVVSLIVISSYTLDGTSTVVRSQMQWFILGWCVFFFFVGFDYNKLREWAWVVYGFSIMALVGLFFTDSVQQVHRWYKVPLFHCSFQPSEYAKMATVIALSWFLERRAGASKNFFTALGGIVIALIPFVLILKQPDLGTALVLYPIVLVMFYFGNVHPFVVKSLVGVGILGLLCVFIIFSGILSHEKGRPYFCTFLKEYQYERLNPNTHHQKAAVTAIAIGGATGVGYKESEYANGGSLPFPYTDSAFSAFGEEFGFIGLLFLLLIFYSLIYCSFQVTAVAKDAFGKLLAAGIGVFIAVHVCVNIGMMSGCLPITGVPLILVSYGGSSVICTMAALGILQSIYSRRFMF